MCIDIVAIWFGIANGQMLSIFCPPHDSGGVLSFLCFIRFIFTTISQFLRGVGIEINSF